MSWLSKLFRKARRWLTLKRLTPRIPKELQRELRDMLVILKETGEQTLNEALQFASLGEYEKLETLFKSKLKQAIGELAEIEDELKDWVIRLLWALALEEIRKRLQKIAEAHPVPEE